MNTRTMEIRPLHKYHAVGNDFLVALDSEGWDGAGARAVCDRHRGVGADGLIALGPAEEGWTFRLWNADGSDAEMSGNGIRCAAHALVDAGVEAPSLRFFTAAGERVVDVRPGSDAASIWASVGMGTVTIRGEGERCNVGTGQLEIDVGNPHLVILGPDPATVDVARLGAELGTATPAGRNVEFVSLGPGPDEVTMRVWERGVGETLACGTGSVAAAVALHHWGRTGPAVTVHQPGGSVVVQVHPNGTASLTGPSRRIARCEVTLG